MHNKKLFLSTLVVIMLCSLLNVYTSSASKVSFVEDSSSDCVLQAEEIKLNVDKSKINGKAVETESITKIDHGIMASLDDNINIVEQKYLGEDVYEISNGVYSSSNYCIGASKIIANNEIVVEDDIQLNAASITSERNIVIYSKNGDVAINASSICINGIIYAPNGTVRINGYSTEVYGRIMAKKIVVSGNSATINSSNEINSMIEKFEFLRNDRMLNIVSFYNVENDKITLMLGEEEETLLKTVYVRYDNGTFEKATETTKGIINLDVSEFKDTADYMIIVADKLGNKTKSPIYSFKKIENCINQVVLDSDSDNIPDGYEVLFGTDPNCSDTDNDGFNDGYEMITLGTDPLTFNKDEDFDNDGLKNSDEMLLGSNPFIKDSDFDGITDNKDSSPLESDNVSELVIIEDIPVVVGEFDYVKRYINENGERCEIVYNWLTDSIKKQSVGNKQVYGVFDTDNHCTAMVTKTPDVSSVNTYTFDGNLISSVTHNGNKYEYNYDENDNLTGVFIDGNNLLSADYDGNLFSTDHTADIDIEYSYDANNNLTGITVDGQEAFSIDYGEDGSIEIYNDYINDVSIKYNYEKVNNKDVLKSVVSSNGFGYEYSNNGNSYETKYFDGEEVKYKKAIVNGDVFNDTYSINTLLITGNSNVVTEKNGYENFNQKIFVNNENIISSDWNINEYGTKKISYQDGKIIDYSYDKNANLSSVNENAKLRNSYEYDSYNQLVRENNYTAGRTYTYNYDNYGNILLVNEYQCTDNGELGAIVGQTTYKYANSSWNDLMTEFNDQEIAYDDVGNPLVYRDGMTFEWGMQKKLIAVANNDNTIKYTYDIDGMRTLKEINGIVTSFNYEDNKIINSTTNGETVWFLYDDRDYIIGMEYKGEAYYFEKNSKDDIERIFNSAGELICSYSYDAFGKIVSVSGDENIAKLNPFRYRSYYFDEETGFYYLKARYYDPVVRRFINADFIEYIGSQGSSASYNLFAYCENNPIMYVDPSGNVLTFNRNCKISGNFESSPVYAPSTWNHQSRKLKANCYCYALNMYGKDSSWGSSDYYCVNPGTISGTEFFNKSGSSWSVRIINALNSDLSSMSKSLGYSSGKYLKAWNWKSAGPVYGAGYDIALVLDIRTKQLKGGLSKKVGGYYLWDYHWYRKDSNNYWSHKPGSTNVVNQDAKGKKISNPQTADRNYSNISGLNYSTYVTSFRIYRYSVWQ